MDFEPWAKGDSVLHRASPHLKIIGAVCFCFAVASCHDIQAVLLGLIVSCLSVLVARIPVAALLKRLLFVNVFTLVCWLTLPVTVTGTEIAHFGFFSISREGFDLALLITIKTNGILLVFISLISTSTVADLGHGLHRLRVPQKLCLLLLFSYRYIFVIHDEYKRLQRAALFRSFKPTTSMHTYQTYGHLFGMTLVKGWKRAGRVQDAMLLRGFSGAFRSLHGSGLRLTDWIILSVVLLVTGLILFFENNGVLL